jgi:hypothetical protein
MLGTKDDWEILREKTISLKKYALNTDSGKYFGKWIERLLKVID